jgi:hypothetical protein
MKRFRHALLGVTMVVLGTLVIPAHRSDAAPTHTEEYVGPFQAPPVFVLQKGADPLNSVLHAYMSFSDDGQNWYRVRISMRAGSGTGNTDTCATSKGWIPDGLYANDDADRGSGFKYIHNKTVSKNIVLGSVWELGKKDCGNGKKRTELFIHSQGKNGAGWSDRNYKSEGCIKISQDDRTYLAEKFEHSYAWNTNQGYLIVEPEGYDPGPL